jgi:methyl halide transferase
MEKIFWKKRYEDKQTGWNIGFASTPIVEYCSQLQDKEIKILIPGCGEGFEADFLFQEGFKNVYVLDFVSEALNRIQERNPNIPVTHFIEADFFTHEGEYDLILEQTLFCAIDPSNRERYIQRIHHLLKPNGKFVGVLFNRDFEAGPPFGGSEKEYNELFRRYFSPFTIETCYNSIDARKGSEVFVNCMK